MTKCILIIVKISLDEYLKDEELIEHDYVMRLLLTTVCTEAQGYIDTEKGAK